MMRIGIDASRFTDSGRGIERYIRNLIFGLASIDKNNEYILLSNSLKGIERFGLPSNFMVEKPSRRFRMIRKSYVSIYGRIVFKDVDLFHFPNSDIWYSKYCKTIVTVHDLAPLHFPDRFFVSDKSYNNYKECLKYLSKNADYILTVSDYSKEDITNNLNFPSGRIIRIYNGIDEKFRRINTDSEILELAKRKLNLPDKFVLFVGGLDFRKNIEVLMKAFHLAIKGDKCSEYKLVIVGNSPLVSNNFYPPLQKICEKLSMDKSIIFQGRVGDDDLVALYNLATLFVFPSIFEGFGFTPLEAMACGCPVICSNRCSLPEVVGDAGILFDPQDINLLSNLIRRLIQSSQMRDELSLKGVNRAGLFTWQKSAQETLAVYQKLATGS